MTTQDIESKIIRRLIRDILAAGCAISVYDGEEYTVTRSRDAAVIIGACATTDETTLTIGNDAGVRIGSIWLVHGNGPDVISDYTDSAAIHAMQAGAATLAESLQ